MIYVSSNLEADVEIQMFGDNDLKLALILLNEQSWPIQALVIDFNIMP